MRGSLVLAVVGIAALGLVALAAIAVVNREDVTMGRDSGASVSPAEERTTKVRAALGASGIAGGNTLGPEQPVPTPPSPAVLGTSPAPSDSWEALEPVGSAEEMGDIGPAFAKALSESFAALGQCFEGATSERYAASGAVPRMAKDSSSSEMLGTPVLMLEFETMTDAVRIVDAPAGTRGSVGDGVILCAQSVLRGMRVDVPGARPGRRYRMRYALVQ